MKMSKQRFSYRKEDLIIIYKKLRIRFSAFIAENRISAYIIVDNYGKQNDVYYKKSNNLIASVRRWSNNVAAAYGKRDNNVTLAHKASRKNEDKKAKIICSNYLTATVLSKMIPGFYIERRVRCVCTGGEPLRWRIYLSEWVKCERKIGNYSI